jgi:glycogen operon protein
MDHSGWHDPRLRTMQMYLQAPAGGQAEGADGGSLLVVVHGGPEAVDVVLPGPPWAGAYRLLWDSSLDRPLSESPEPPPTPAGTPVTVGGPTVLVFAALP